MILDAWQTIWACVGLSLLILFVDGVLAGRAGPSKTDLVRQKREMTEWLGSVKG